MFLHEFQAKDLLSRYGVAVPDGGVAIRPEEARAVAERLGAPGFALQAPLRAGGRGKAGGVALVRYAAEAEAAANRLLGRTLVTEQSGPAGQSIKRVLVEAAAEPVRSLYLAVMVDAARGVIVLAAAPHGGTDVEQLIDADTAQIDHVSLGDGSAMPDAEVKALAARLGLDEAAAAFATLSGQVLKCLVESDATLIEINPLALLADGSFLALDVKLVVDDNALFRQPWLSACRDEEELADVELKAQNRQLNYLRLDGSVGIVANGAGLGLATLDMVTDAGGRPANFMDIRTTATSMDVAHGFALLLDNPNVRSLLINVHGGGMQPCDTIVEGLGIALRRTGRRIPTIVRLAGNNAAFGRSRFHSFGCKVTEASDMGRAAALAVAAAG